MRSGCLWLRYVSNMKQGVLFFCVLLLDFCSYFLHLCNIDVGQNVVIANIYLFWNEPLPCGNAKISKTYVC